MFRGLQSCGQDRGRRTECPFRLALLRQCPSFLHPHALLLHSGRLLTLADHEQCAKVKVPLLRLTLFGHVPDVRHLNHTDAYQLPDHLQSKHIRAHLLARRTCQRYGRRAFLRAAADDGVLQLGRIVRSHAGSHLFGAASLALRLALRLVDLVLRLVLVRLLLLCALPPMAPRMAHAHQGQQAEAINVCCRSGHPQLRRYPRVLAPLRGHLRRTREAWDEFAVDFRHRLGELVLSGLLSIPPILAARLRRRCCLRLHL
mmetsp:Transcript_30799/g.94414  ORF Transcript_30799/g.94414 Transcript_30799/m.94414 type:complete len:258 (-) Transcript_30799:1312-2085(-)